MAEGIDVSNHQERIDWAQVRRKGIAFALVKASEGVTFADPKFGAHTQGARKVGIKAGAYHFARPDTSAGRTVETVRLDARAEADFFLEVAALRTGHLLPALDLETAGLSPRLMVEWTRAWLEHVRDRIGARPLLYTYPYFWRSLGGTTAFRNYPLWIANYEVDEPALPDGWPRYAIWQYTSSGSVGGVPGRVDRNRLGPGVELADITYRPTKRPPVPRQKLPGPVPKPEWFWAWLRWRVGEGEFEGLAGDERVRPDEAPAEIPDWARRCLQKLERERMRPVPRQKLPGPVPKPEWFWPWLRWRLGEGEFEGLGGNENVRPDEAPEKIPDWARSCLQKLARERKTGP